MGWKNVKEYYRIEYFPFCVHITSNGICVGSPYLPELIIIGMGGLLIKRYEEGGWENSELIKRYGIDSSSINTKLVGYQAEMDADPEKLKSLVTSEDTFKKNVPVYIYEGGEVIEKLCEEPGWPNVTHDGCLMYKNRWCIKRNKLFWELF